MCHETREQSFNIYCEIELDSSTGAAGAVPKSKRSNHTTTYIHTYIHRHEKFSFLLHQRFFSENQHKTVFSKRFSFLDSSMWWSSREFKTVNVGGEVVPMPTTVAQVIETCFC